MIIKDYYRAESLQDAITYYGKEKCIIFAGGTDITIKAKERNLYKDDVLLDISELKELRGISDCGGEIKIGATVTLTELLKSDLVLEKIPLLYEAVSHVGSCQIRNRATLGGNVANACPASDCIPALMVLGARVVVEGTKGEREILIADLFKDCKACLRHEGMCVRTCYYPQPTKKKLTLEEDEIITAIYIPVQEKSERYFFYKINPNKSGNLAVINMAMTGGMDVDGKIQKMKLCLGGIFSKPRCFDELSSILIGNKSDEKLFHEYGEKVAVFMENEAGILAEYDYKRKVVPRIIEDGCCEMFMEKILDR